VEWVALSQVLPEFVERVLLQILLRDSWQSAAILLSMKGYIT
jgi:hypothetical protein